MSHRAAFDMAGDLVAVMLIIATAVVLNEILARIFGAVQ